MIYVASGKRKDGQLIKPPSEFWTILCHLRLCLDPQLEVIEKYLDL